MTGSPGTRAASMPAAIAGLLLTTATAMAAAPKADQVLCWMDRSTDSKLKHLYCSSREAAAGSHCNARNALLHMAEMLDIDAGDPWLGRTPSRSGKQVYVSSFTIAEGQVNRLIQQLGPGSVDWAIIRATENLRKAPLPEDAPSDEEMAWFGGGLRAVGFIRWASSR